MMMKIVLIAFLISVVLTDDYSRAKLVFRDFSSGHGSSSGASGYGGHSSGYGSGGSGYGSGGHGSGSGSGEYLTPIPIGPNCEECITIRHTPGQPPELTGEYK